MLSALDNLRHGSILDLLLHPNGDMVLSIITDGVTILAFEDSIKSLSVERWEFWGLGMFCYIGAAVGAYYLFTGKYRKYCQ